MVMTPSSMMPLGTKAPNFKLVDVVSDKTLTLTELKGEKATVIIFMCNHCPYVIHVLNQLVSLNKDYQNRGISFISISSNDVQNYPEDSPQKMKDLAEGLGNPFPYLFDETQEIAKAYSAACTPDFFIFDKGLGCVYRGQLDDSRPGNNNPVTGQDIRSALDNIIVENKIDPNQKPSIGCNIKWR